MRKLSVFDQISVDGYFSDAQGDMSWAHKHDPEWNAFASDNASGNGMLLFGRVTYEMMASFWPTQAARETNPAVAAGINALPKVVFSRTLREASWNNTRLLKGDLVSQVRELKAQSGPDMVILGSGSIVAQLSEARLIDEYQLVVNPVALGAGRTLFEGLTRRLELKPTRTRTFQNGNVVIWYQPAER